MRNTVVEHHGHFSLTQAQVLLFIGLIATWAIPRAVENSLSFACRRIEEYADHVDLVFLFLGLLAQQFVGREMDKQAWV